MTDTAELPTLPDSTLGKEPAWTALDHYALIRVTGPDALKFMQGQFTCDLTEITPERSRLGACCTPKGRMLALFRIARVGDEYWLRLPDALAQPLVDHLKKYIPFFKAQLILDDTLSAIGLIGDIAGLELPPEPVDSARALDDGILIRVPGTVPRFEHWGSSAGIANMSTRLASSVQRPKSWWELTDILAGIGEVYGETREEFIPQMLNLQSLGGISFKKGCYTGQEIVARMQYLGTLKRRMYLARANAPLTLTPGTVIQDGQGTALGQVIRSQVTAEQTTELLALLPQEELAPDISLQVDDGNASVALQWREVPYPVETIRNERKKH